jgi:hypothetical protein
MISIIFGRSTIKKTSAAFTTEVKIYPPASLEFMAGLGSLKAESRANHLQPDINKKQK